MTRARVSVRTDGSRDGAEPVARHSVLGWPGFVFVGLAVFLAVGAVNSQNNLLFWVFGVSVSGVIVSGLVSGNALMGLRLVARPPRVCEVGQPASIRYTLTSRARRSHAFGLEIREGSSAGGPLTTDRAGVMFLPARGSAEARLVWTPAARGPVALDRITVESRFPFGLLVKSLEFSQPRTAWVRPPRVDLRSGLMRTTRPSGRAGVSRARTRSGGGSEFYAVREYMPGDPRRSIAWRPSARRGELLVVHRVEPRAESGWVWVPTPVIREEQSWHSRIIAERSLALVRALVEEGFASGRPIGVWLPWAGVRIAPDASAAHAERVADTLARIDLDAITTDDTPPPSDGDARVIRIASVSVPGDGDALVLDPTMPDQWLAPGAELHASLRVGGQE